MLEERDCVVSKIANAPGQYTGLYEIELSVEDPDVKLKHGFFAKGEIYPSELNDCYSLPMGAVQEGIGNLISFYSVSKDRTVALKQESNVISITQDKVYISQTDLDDEMFVIVEKQKELKHLDKIRIVDNEIFALLN